jgi:hypothetical protein
MKQVASSAGLLLGFFDPEEGGGILLINVG